jgi:GNAT superfamily N-acetyltransferase
MMFTYPRERRKGYGGMLMKWGMEKAAEMGVEVAVEASDQGYGLYKKHGLRTIQKMAIDTIIDQPSNLWKRLESDFGDTLIWWMWKPVHGIYEMGKTELPWEATKKD